MTYDQEIVLEVERQGRRPRYHRGARQAGTGVRLDPPQCNLDDVAAKVNVLATLPALSTREAPTQLRRPWSQLCRRCWEGSDVWTAAVALGDSYALLKARLAGKEA